MAPIYTKTVLMTALLALPLAASAPAFAQEAKPREPVISVTGDGESSVAPDMAVVNLAVVKQAKTAREALDENNKAMNDVLAALKSGGIAERDLQTSGFSIQPQYNYPQPVDGQQQQPQLIGYQTINSVTVRLRDLAKLGAVIDQSVSLGINQGGEIQFTNDKPDAAIEEARKAAVADAVKRAKTLSEAAGVKLGRILEINENVPRAMPQPVYRATMMKEASDAAVPVQGGENSYNVSVTVTFAIEQ
ncbi:SIMPL domain-containing protein [Rhizobium leguminosarum]|uniref:SIMPL domain-containing protein n=1 Tax=Rhizobium leguminosarum TaxID=384 RepID=UPI001A92B4DB|nr:SIMPL domain-containing protein [Rhizobium leguminosarum]MBY5558772.1 SIMPL domain-containing protein [Rhizobium leguminosarum]MBY5633214.1 SIMPL domain-containing protein [Rhizobium leguminosarum]MBY5687936.1 SIMPL domain-containing protein [Rhizobium leguminosarum]MBY5726848.1 SIMPL domain-containing protein [Rhizobium leguminosarum]MBY5742452.1 SIMPL domain-containing protein [Rhizobium leguminosarum]